MSDLDIAGLDGWVPLPVELSGDALEADMRARVPDQDESAYPLAAKLAADVKARNDATDVGPLLAMWARYDTRGDIVPICIATMRLVAVPPTTTPQALAHELMEGVPLHRPYAVETIETSGGPAYQLEAVIDLGPDARGAQYLRSDVVFWLAAEDGQALVLDTQTADLVRGSRLGAELGQLARGVTWVP
jgi:hypothetical protein